IVIEKNEDYWDADEVTLETVNMHMIDDESTEQQMYENGDLDWAGDPTGAIPLAAIPTMKEEGELEISDRSGVIICHSTMMRSHSIMKISVRHSHQLLIGNQLLKTSPKVKRNQQWVLFHLPFSQKTKKDILRTTIL